MSPTSQQRARLTAASTNPTLLGYEYLKLPSPSVAALLVAACIFIIILAIFQWLRQRQNLRSNLVYPSNVKSLSQKGCAICKLKRCLPQNQPSTALAGSTAPTALKYTKTMEDSQSNHGADTDGKRPEYRPKQDWSIGKRRQFVDPSWRRAGNHRPGLMFSQMPPAPPLTPPELSSVIFSPSERPRSHDSYIDHPNPDYYSATSGSTYEASTSSPTTPRLRSYQYNRTIPIRIPGRNSSLSESDPPDLTMSPSSYPPTSPLLPPPPPGHEEKEESAQQGEGRGKQEFNVHGEVVSMVDHNGIGWSRHTRVYGGGVCLACAASGGEGGFYGATVRPEDMRY